MRGQGSSIGNTRPDLVSGRLPPISLVSLLPALLVSSLVSGMVSTAVVGGASGCSLDRRPTIATTTGSKALGQNGGASGVSASGAGGSVGNPMAGTNSIGNAGASGFGSAGFAGAGNGAGAGGGAAGASGAGGAAGTGPLPVVCATNASKIGQCKATAAGVYALKNELDVWWMDEVNPMQPLIDPGRDVMTIYFVATIDRLCPDGSAGETVLRACGARLPPFFVDSVCKVIQIEFPDEIWDRPSMPTYRTKSSVSGFNPGDFLSVEKVTGLLGIELPALEGTWPTAQQTAGFACPSGTGQQCFPDQDADGHWGVTVHMNPGGVVTNAPYACGSGAAWKKAASPLGLGQAAFNLPGAQTAYIGVRWGLGGKGKLGAGCVGGAGPGQSSLTIPSRVIDCVVENGQPCSPTDANFVDQNVPNYHLLQLGEAPPAAPTWQHPRENSSNPLIPKVTLNRSASLGPRTSVVRLGDLGTSVTCDMARNAAFPAFE